MNTNQSNTPISRDEQVATIKAYAECLNSVSSITTISTHVVIVLNDAVEATVLTKHLFNAGWHNVTNNPAQLSNKSFVRVPINFM